MEEGLNELELDLGYSSDYGDLVERFYSPCLARSERYYRSVGYFKSSFFAITALVFSRFVERGGGARIVCSPDLSEEDWGAIDAGYDLRKRCDERMRKSIRELLNGDTGELGVRYLAGLIAVGALEIRVAVPSRGYGVFHEKLGVFDDGRGHRVSFVGSSNETFMAWSEAGNHERFEVFTSWMSPESKRRCDRHLSYFESLWCDEVAEVDVIELPSDTREMIGGLWTSDGFETVAREFHHAVSEKLKSDVKGAFGGGRETEVEPYTLQDHQEATVDDWWKKGQSGVVCHATGAGKTVTGLEIVRQWVDDSRPAIITVPTQVLQDQWEEEIERHLCDLEYKLLRVGGSNPKRKWIEYVSDFTRSSRALGARIVLGLIQSVSSHDFLNRCRDGQHLLVVSDEVHVTGAPTFRRLFGLDAGGRLGLSATPERYGDPEGTDAIREFFGDNMEPEISLTDAIACGRLVPYEYHLHETRLTNREQDEWERMTKVISREYARLPDGDDGQKSFTDRFRMMLIKRARIVKQASNKTRVCTDVVTDEFSPGDRWLVYCDDTEQLNEIATSLRSEGLDVVEYHSKMESDRDAAMEYFGRNSCVMVAIKCLDEGVDVPAANCAFVVASSSNPREFIQRRGRVLRRSPDKRSAQVHDSVVLPRPGSSKSGNESLLATELRRAWLFAQGARNRSCEVDILEAARRFGFDITEVADIGYESDENVAGESV